MQISANGLKKLMEWEEVRLTAYHDSAEKLSIGVGHLIQPGEDFSKGLTTEQAQDLLADDLTRFEHAVNTRVKVPLTQNQYDALVIFSFNIGVAGFQSSSALKVLNSGDYAGVPARMKLWNKETRKGKLVVSKGLINRRNKEIKLWQS